MLKHFILAGLVALSAALPVAAETIETSINGKTVVLQQTPVRHQGAILVPFKELVRELGGSVAFDPIARDWTAIYKDNVVTFDMLTPTVWLNGRLERLPALVTADELMVPMDFASRILGTELKYDQFANRIAIDPGPVLIPGMTTPVAYTPSVVTAHRALLLSEDALPVVETHLVKMPLTERVPQADLDIAFVNVMPGQAGVDQFRLVGVTQPDATVSVKSVRNGVYTRLPAGEYTTTADATGRFDMFIDTTGIPASSDLTLELQAKDSVGNLGPSQRVTLPGRP